MLWIQVSVIVNNSHVPFFFSYLALKIISKVQVHLTTVCRQWTRKCKIKRIGLKRTCWSGPENCVKRENSGSLKKKRRGGGEQVIILVYPWTFWKEMESHGWTTSLGPIFSGESSWYFGLWNLQSTTYVTFCDCSASFLRFLLCISLFTRWLY